MGQVHQCNIEKEQLELQYQSVQDELAAKLAEVEKMRQQQIATVVQLQARRLILFRADLYYFQNQADREKERKQTVRMSQAAQKGAATAGKKQQEAMQRMKAKNDKYAILSSTIVVCQ